MKKPLLFSFLILSFAVHSQVICGTAGEGATLTLTAPPGNVFTTIEYASYGTPTGSCGAFANSSCHAVNSQAICEAVFIGQNSASIDAVNGIFGDPCGGTVKWLTVQARYSTTLPLKLVSFSAQRINTEKVRIAWTTAEENNTAYFVIEKNNGGDSYTRVDTVSANGQGSHTYSYISTTIADSPDQFYRLRMVDKDGKQQFSNILRISNGTVNFALSVYPNPVTDLLTIVSSRQELLTIYNSNGHLLTSLLLNSGSQTLNVSGWPKGMYIVKAGTSVAKFLKN